jgi:hypothetical protein
MNGIQPQLLCTSYSIHPLRLDYSTRPFGMLARSAGETYGSQLKS